MWTAAGLQARVQEIWGHTVSDVYYDGAWHMLDGNVKVCYLARDNKTIAGMDELERMTQLPEDVREFMLQPGNLLYVRVAMQLSDLSAEALRNVAEGLLDITY